MFTKHHEVNEVIALNHRSIFITITTIQLYVVNNLERSRGSGQQEKEASDIEDEDIRKQTQDQAT